LFYLKSFLGTHLLLKSNAYDKTTGNPMKI